ncbi:UNVERIFIED_CONTAM: hypothetical protein Sindi_2001500, partial [Sesamum indicum]
MVPHVKSAAQATQNHDVTVKDLQLEIHSSNNLWIGNLSPKVTDSELKSLSATHGEVMGINSFPLRQYVFVRFKEIECAKLEWQGRQGHIVHEKTLMINFAKPV